MGHRYEMIAGPMTERTFIILRYVNKVPAMASCAKCKLKFFASNTYRNDPFQAEQYLRQKFEEHECGEETKGIKSKWQI